MTTPEAPKPTGMTHRELGLCIERVHAWHDKKGEKSISCARRAMRGPYCTQHARRHLMGDAVAAPASVDKSKCFFPPNCPGCSNCDPFRPMKG